MDKLRRVSGPNRKRSSQFNVVNYVTLRRSKVQLTDGK